MGVVSGSREEVRVWVGRPFPTRGRYSLLPVGMKGVGVAVGVVPGSRVGVLVGVGVGVAVGPVVGVGVRVGVGVFVGVEVGVAVGPATGVEVGVGVGIRLGSKPGGGSKSTRTDLAAVVMRPALSMILMLTAKVLWKGLMPT